MVSRWNPHAPNVAGAEWFGSKVVAQPIAALIGRGPTIVARLSQSVTELAALVARSSGTAGGIAETAVAVDVYDLANPPGPDTQTWVIALPEANDSAAAGWVKSASGVESAYDANAYKNVAQVVSTSDPLNVGVSDQIRYQGVNPTTAPQARFFAGDSILYDGDTGVGTVGGTLLTGKRISSVEVVAVVENTSTHSVRFVGQVRVGGTTYNADSGPEIIGFETPALQRVRFAFYSNPATGLPWTNADALALTDSVTDSFGVAVITKSGAGNFIVTALFLQFRVLTERRVATGHGTMLTDQNWMHFLLLNPATNATAPWAKTLGHEYLFLYSLTRGSQAAELALIDTTATAAIGSAPLTDAAAQGWTLDHGTVPLAQDADLEGQIATVMYVGAAVSLDSLPYGSIKNLAAATFGTSHKQTISTHSSQAYGSATILVTRSGGGQDAGLVVTLKKSSDNTVLAGPTTIAPSDVPADGKYHIVRVLFAAPAALVAGVGVYVEAVSASSIAWGLLSYETRLPTMGDTDLGAIAAAAAGVGGAADSADAIVIRDFPWSIIISPPAPTGLTATAATIANRPALTYDAVGITIPAPNTIGYAHLDWTSTALGAGFDLYEIQRQDAGVWHTIARVGLEVSSYFNDFEGPRGIVGALVARNYRVRVQSTDGGISAWATFPAVNISVDHCADVVVSSNFDPASSLAFRDLTPTHAWDQLQTARGKMQPILGRDFPVAFWPAEQGGEAFARKLAIAYNDPAVASGGVVTPDRAVFDPVLALLQNRTLPYLSYADSWGRTWLTSPSVQPPGPTREEPDGRYSIEVLFTQVEDLPVVLEVDVPWLP